MFFTPRQLDPKREEKGARVMKAIVGVVLVLFAALNLYALSTASLHDLIATVTQGNAWHTVFMVDLAIALGVILTWLWRDARSRGSSPLPYVIITMFTGSIGPLLYLLRRKEASAE
jgi:hypothetical protein